MRATSHRPVPQYPPPQLHARATDNLHLARRTKDRAAGAPAPDLDPLIHERLGLGIVSALARYLDHMEALTRASRAR